MAVKKASQTLANQIKQAVENNPDIFGHDPVAGTIWLKEDEGYQEGYYRSKEVLQELGSRALALHGAGNQEVEDVAVALTDAPATTQFMVQLLHKLIGSDMTENKIELDLVPLSLHIADLLVADRQLRLESVLRSQAAQEKEALLELAKR